MLNLFRSFSSEFWMRSAKRSIRLSCWSWLESIRELASRTAPSIDPSRHHRRQRRFRPWAASPAIISSKSIREIKKFYSQDGFKSVVELRSKIFQNKVSALSSTWAFFDSRTLTQNDDRLFDSARRRQAETFEWKASSLIKKKFSFLNLLLASPLEDHFKVVRKFTREKKTRMSPCDVQRNCEN